MSVKEFTYKPIVAYEEQMPRIEKLKEILTRAGIGKSVLDIYISLIIDYEPVLEGNDMNIAPVISAGDNRLSNFFDLIDSGLLEQLIEIGLKKVHLAELAYFVVQYAQEGNIKAVAENDVVKDMKALGLTSNDISKLTMFATSQNTPERIGDIKHLKKLTTKEAVKAALNESLESGVSERIKALYERTRSARKTEMVASVASEEKLENTREA